MTQEGGFTKSPDFSIVDKLRNGSGGGQQGLCRGMEGHDIAIGELEGEGDGDGYADINGVDGKVKKVDTLIIGNGPSALFLSYLLNGNHPVYDPLTFGPHPDHVLHSKLMRALSSCSATGPSLSSLAAHIPPTEIPLYHVLDCPEAIESLTEHFPHSHMSYSSQALPVNVLLDTLLRPNADIDPEAESRIQWVKNERLRIPHLVVGAAYPPGGQWSEDPIDISDDIKTLSYANMLSLPGYTFEQHYESLYDRQKIPQFMRPTRREVSSYYSTYPRMVGIEKNILSPAYASRVERAAGGGFLVRVSYKGRKLRSNEQRIMVKCQNVVLASGLFRNVIPPPKILRPLAALPRRLWREGEPHSAPLLVIGSGFTAADVILSAPASQKILQIYKWGIPKRPSPLKGCHPQAYPEYASVYKKMKAAASPERLASLRLREGKDFGSVYEGFPNGEVVGVRSNPHNAETCIVSIRIHPSHKSEDMNEIVVEREVGGLKYCVGRRGDLGYLAPQLQKELGLAPPAPVHPPWPNMGTSLPFPSPVNWIHNMALREMVGKDLEVAKGIFVVGSLTGDSLVKFAGGGVVYTAGRLAEMFTKRRKSECEEGLIGRVENCVENNGSGRDFFRGTACLCNRWRQGCIWMGMG